MCESWLTYSWVSCGQYLTHVYFMHKLCPWLSNQFTWLLTLKSRQPILGSQRIFVSVQHVRVRRFQLVRVEFRRFADKLQLLVYSDSSELIVMLSPDSSAPRRPNHFYITCMNIKSEASSETLPNVDGPWRLCLDRVYAQTHLVLHCTQMQRYHVFAMA